MSDTHEALSNLWQGQLLQIMVGSIAFSPHLTVGLVSHFLDVGSSCKGFVALASDYNCSHAVIGLMLLSCVYNFLHDLG